MKTNYRSLYYFIALNFLFFLSIPICFGQIINNSGLKSTVTSLTNILEKLPVEKLYLQTDKPYYTAGDTLRFKAYLLNGDYLTAALKSRLLYIELDDISNISVKRIMVPVNGVAWGDIALDAKEIPEGYYTLRAYTNWMRNFGEDYVFKKPIYISAVNNETTLVNTNFKLIKQADKTNIQANLRFTELNKDALRLKDMQFWVKGGNKVVLRDKASTRMDGGMDVNFTLPDKTDANKIAIQVQEIKKDGSAPKLSIPIALNRPENTDIQFMPEGGNLVSGIPTKIGFKAIGEDGKGVNVTGKVYNTKQEIAATFKAAHLGMGAFELTPQEGETYIARVTLPNGAIKSYPLPAVNTSGTTLRVNQNSDSLEVQVTAKNVEQANYYLIAQSRGVVCYAATIRFTKNQTKLIIARNFFPSGIAHFTLLNSAKQAINERIIYIDRHDNLRIKIAADQPNYATRDSIALTIHISDKDGRPVKGTFSMAVTDDSQVKTDSLGSNITNDLLLSSDLKGTVEQPGYYFADNGNVEKTAELDNLLLTQGWIGYDWKQVFNQVATAPKYNQEYEYTIKGSVTNAFNKPIANTGVLLQSLKPAFVIDTITDSNGRFLFKGFTPIDTAKFILQAKNHNGKTFNVKLAVDGFQAPVFAKSEQQAIPWYVNSDTVLLHSLATKQQAEIKLTGPHVLKEVTIKAKKIIKDSQNPNGEGMADEVLDEKDMEKAEKTTLMQIIKKLGGFSDANPLKIHSQYLILIIDGVNVTESYIPPPGITYASGEFGNYFSNERYAYVKSYLDYITAEDITGIESSFNSDKIMGYGMRYYYEYTIHHGPPPFAYVEVTTRYGNGYVLQSTPGVYEYRPLAITLPKQFYRPRYTVNNGDIAPGTDVRSTIHWEPNIITNAAGKATVSFYSADVPATYSIIIEGSNLNGGAGFKRDKILVHNPTQN